MRLNEEIKRIFEIMDIPQPKPSEEEYKRALKEVMPLAAEMAHRKIHKDNLEYTDETLMRITNEIMDSVKQGNDDVLDIFWGASWSGVIKHAINVISAYHGV